MGGTGAPDHGGEWMKNPLGRRSRGNRPTRSSAFLFYNETASVYGFVNPAPALALAPRAVSIGALPM